MTPEEVLAEAHHRYHTDHVHRSTASLVVGILATIPGIDLDSTQIALVKQSASIALTIAGRSIERGINPADQMFQVDAIQLGQLIPRRPPAGLLIDDTTAEINLDGRDGA